MTEKADAQILTGHTVVRDGSVWLCTRCRRELGPFGAGMPVVVADCEPRRWADGGVG
jgi:hypothetical protein